MNTRMPKTGEEGWKNSAFKDIIILAHDDETQTVWAKMDEYPLTYDEWNWSNWHPPVDRSNDREQYYNVYVWDKFELLTQISEEDADTNALLDQRVALVRFAITDGKFTAEVVK